MQVAFPLLTSPMGGGIVSVWTYAFQDFANFQNLFIILNEPNAASRLFFLWLGLQLCKGGGDSIQLYTGFLIDIVLIAKDVIYLFA